MLLAASFCQQAATMSAYKFSPRAVASPDAPQKPLVRKRARSEGVKWVQVSRDEPGQKAKKPRTAGSQQPACTHEGFVWVKSGYSETVAWRKVRLTKQHNVDLTTDGLWAMPLNTGWVPVKARRLQDWEKLKNNQWSLEHCSVLCMVQIAALFAQKCDLLPPPQPIHF